MRHVNFDLSLDFDDAESADASERFLLRSLTELAAHNLNYLRTHPETPKLYDAGIAYLMPEQLDRQPSRGQIAELKNFLRGRMGMTDDEIDHHVDLARGVEIFRDISRIIDHGGGDCDNLAGWCAAERALAGIDCRPYLTKRLQGGRTIYHALVLWPDGSSEDPSRILGMPCPEGERREECRKNVERYDNYWQDAKRLLAAEDLGSESARYNRALELKAAIDEIGLLPKDGVFRAPARPAPKHKHWWNVFSRAA